MRTDKDSYLRFHDDLSVFFAWENLWILAWQKSDSQHLIAKQFLMMVKDNSPDCLICTSCPNGTLTWTWAHLVNKKK